MYCDKMRSVICAIAEKYGNKMEVDEDGEVLELSLGEGYHPLTIEFYPADEDIGEPAAVVVAHYYEQNGDQVPDPELWIARTKNGWVPYSLRQMYMPRETHANVSDGQVKVITNQGMFNHLVQFAELWADLLEQRYVHSDKVLVMSN